MRKRGAESGEPEVFWWLEKVERRIWGKGEQMARDQHVNDVYLVRVGHWEVRVKARNGEEAIRAARLQMKRELPRLYDVIRALAASRFRVEAAA